LNASIFLKKATLLNVAAGILSTKGHQNPPQLEVLKQLSANLKDLP
jgi:hypothetical protein